MHAALNRLSLLLLLTGCQEPFGVARQDLVGDRIIALTVQDDGASRITARSALLTDGDLYTDEPVTLDWVWAPTLDAVATASPDRASAQGPAVSLRTEAPVLGLIATFPSGAVHRAAIELPEQRDPPALTSLGIEARTVAPDDVVPLTVPSTLRSRFMTVHGRGTVVETTTTTADLTIAELTFDDGEEESREPTEDGVLQVFGLSVGDGNAWRVEDLWVGTPPQGVFLAEGWFLPSDVVMASGTHEVLLDADDDAPWGLRITETRTATTAPPLDLSTLVTQEVLRSELVGVWHTVDVP